LVDQLATHLLPPLPDKSGLDLTIRKPSALPFACPSISISRTKATSRRPTRTSLTETTGSNETDTQGERVFIALGSNIGDRVGNIRRAVDGLEKERVEVVRTGRMYESEPMYVEDQARFINTVIEVSFSLLPFSFHKPLC
jgi:dihydroneopterin aldolase/2-amino-4-hydroxy-6-hydroxymethyldihydropteridine diphosphokinase/dihydropteroate synthase